MASPNQLNPDFLGPISAAGYRDLEEKGVSITCLETNGTTSVSVFGTTNPFNGVIKGWFSTSKSGIAATLTMYNDAASVGTIAKGTTTGALVGPTGDLSNTTIAKDGSVYIISSSSDAEAAAYVYIAFSLTD